MGRRQLLISNSVRRDIQQIEYYIIWEYSALQSAQKFKIELIQYLERIALHPEIYPLNNFQQLRCYGFSDMRKAVFRRKWVILFDFDNTYVIIRKIMHCAAIIS